MVIVQINSTCGVGSTGKICMSVSQLLNSEDIENYICYSTGNSDYQNSFKFCGEKYKKIQALKGRLFGNNGFNAKKSTQKLIEFLREKKPDIIHLHNLHSNDINLELLFNFIRENKIKTYYTFHDCWAFTGYCPHFTMESCNKWMSSCHNCTYRKKTSWLFDRSNEMQKRKKKALEGIDLTIITPSQWLADLVKHSFLKEYPIKVINNGIDLSIFKPTYSSFREKYNLINKYIILGVSFGWGIKKGLDVFLELNTLLDKTKYQIVLVGTNKKVDNKLPKDIISIHKTQNQKELAEIYTACDLFFNPTKEENYPTVNMEAIACGTPVLTFNTGGCSEMLTSKTGAIVQNQSISAIIKQIECIAREDTFSKDNCVTNAKSFDMNDRFKEYLHLYEGDD